MSEYRYILEPYKGKKTRYTCPTCKHSKEYVRYIDTITGEYLPMKYGYCNRRDSCKYDLNPYTDGYGRIHTSNENYQVDRQIGRTKFESTDKLQTAVYIPSNIFGGSLNRYEQNSFVAYLNSLLGDSITLGLIERFHIGTSNYWKGASVFWLIDLQARIAGGQVILFDNSGHTYKEIKPNGEKKRFNSWIHTALVSSYKKQKKTLPEWLKDYKDHSPKFPFPFGLHQLAYEPPTKPIAIVEAAKTAVIATAYLPQYIWLAVGGMSYLNEARLLPLKGRNITLFPDRGGFENWNNKIKSLSDMANFTISDLLESKKVEHGSDLADYLTKYNIKDFKK